MITIDEITARHNEWRKMAFYLGATTDNVDDVIQDFYIKILEINETDGNLQRITGENGKLQTYYVCIIHLLCRKYGYIMKLLWTYYVRIIKCLPDADINTIIRLIIIFHNPDNCIFETFHNYSIILILRLP